MKPIFKLRRFFPFIFLNTFICCLPALIFSSAACSSGEQTSQTQQTEKKYPGFDLSLGLTAGYNYNTMTKFIRGESPELTIYLRQLGLLYAFNNFGFYVTGTFDINPRIGISATFPFAFVTKESIDFQNNMSDFGVGDFSFRLYFNVIKKEKSKPMKPQLQLYSDVNSNLSKFYPLGDGRWNITLGGKITKPLFEFNQDYQILLKSFSIFGLADYTFAMDRTDITGGNIVGYGVGFKAKGDILGLVVQAKGQHTNKTFFKDRTLFGSGDDVILNFSLNYYKSCLSLNIGGLGQGVGLAKNRIGVEAVFPLDFWEWNKINGK
jgi:hypothetical protein